MTCVEGLLSSVAQSVEAEIRPRLSGLLGGMVRAYLPQTWVFRTEDGVASLTVDVHGRATVAPSASPNPDVTIEIPHDRLRAALTTRNRASVPPGPLTVTPHTAKGRTAFDYLRSRLGL